jgi:hypothetical protein
MSNLVNEFILRRTNTLNAQHLPPKLVQVSTHYGYSYAPLAPYPQNHKQQKPACVCAVLQQLYDLCLLHHRHPLIMPRWYAAG